MTVLLDTTLVAREDRAEAFHAALNAASNPMRVSVAPQTQGTIHAWALGSGINMIQLSLTAGQLLMERTQRHLRQAGPERLSVAVNDAGLCTTTNNGVQVTQNQQLRLTDLTTPYGLTWQDHCHAAAVEIDYTRIGLSVDAIRAAQPQIHASPLHDMLRRHLLDLVRAADKMSSEAALFAGSATAELVRATFSSISHRDLDRKSALAETLPARIEDYVRRHLGDSDLTPARVAAAHHISLRYLYVLLAEKSSTPAEWFMALRLEQARHELTKGSDNIAATAHRWGFKDASHFSRRFKATYGITPREWTQSQPIA